MDCKAPACSCASSAIPGGLAQSDTPQMIVVSFVDSITDQTVGWANQMLGGLKNPDGCELPATFYTVTAGANFFQIRSQYDKGHEIAPMSLTRFVGPFLTPDGWRAEIKGARDLLAVQTKIPLSDLVGWRAPYLATGKKVWEVLKAEGFLYDSSIPESIGLGSMSVSTRSFIWPYTFDSLWAQKSAWQELPDQPVPGLFEVPIYQWYKTPTGTYWNPFDPIDPTGTSEELLELFKRTFQERYEGNRAPMGFHLRNAWASNANYTKAFRDFTTWVQTTYGQDAWFVTTRQLVEWVKAPTAVPEMKAFIGKNGGCVAPTAAAADISASSAAARRASRDDSSVSTESAATNSATSSSAVLGAAVGAVAVLVVGVAAVLIAKRRQAVPLPL